jgi:hypothetical protein
MEGKLFWSFNNNVFACGVPPNHMVVLWTFKETLQRMDEPERES